MIVTAYKGGKAFRFGGDGYVEFSKSLLPHSSSTNREIVSMVITTNATDGLIFWHGQEPTTPGKGGQDYMAIALSGGQILYRLVHSEI